ncbi:CinA family protein [Nocardioides sp. Kera G14]|uniref:CinA family protein n=1 Tax=Nocardioides sp. Kera G14 TaxID=2884264 RepID=UPI001D12BE6A|nr:CinA family protein [Nocardioides sp. Kera G14]UDY25073.1 CinA family protein [Nocardioides sp. Kera G14]
MTSADHVHQVLKDAEATVATAESLTGGQLASQLTNVPGSSQTYGGGAVTYWTSLKIALLGVPEALVQEYGVVSAECAESMATGVRDVAGTTYGLATTGVAGPDEQEGKPVGTVFVGVAGPSGARSIQLNLDGERADIQAQTCAAALELLADEVSVRE